LFDNSVFVFHTPFLTWYWKKRKLPILTF